MSVQLDETESQLLLDVQVNGKFTKVQTAYLPFNFFLSGVNCGNCRFFEAETNTCKIVSGRIIPRGLCHLFIPSGLDPTFLQEYIFYTYQDLPPYATFVIGAGIIGVAIAANRKIL